jgi:peptide/nickel transport system permease protein
MTTFESFPTSVAVPDRLAHVRKLFTFARRNPMGAIGITIIVVFILIAIFAPLLAGHDPYAMDSNVILAPPSAQHWMGTDEFGRDVMSRIIWGSRISLYVGLIAVGLGTTSGALIGMVSAYFGGKLDYCVQRVMDMLMAFPMLVLALAMVAALGSSIQNVIIALAVVIAPNAARVIRSSVLSIKEKPFIEAAQSLGYSSFRILFVHVLPNCLAPYIILATAGLGGAILSEASLSFLGLGTVPPEPSWGAMLSGKTQRYMTEAPWLAIFPGLAITLVVFGFNFLGDALRDILDPRMRMRK